jgi:two-component system, NarL family, nitrate/nitrite response regulator NarL
VLQPNLAILSDRNLFREGVVQLLRANGFQNVTEYHSAPELLRSLKSTPPRLVLIDMDHGADDPFPLLHELRHHSPRTTVVVIGTALQSAAVDGDAEASLETPGANAQVLAAVAGLALRPEAGPLPVQPSQEFQEQRQRWGNLTPRQREVLGYLSTGSDNLKIAANLGISERAVKAHVSALLSLFHAENRTELAVLACRAGLRPPVRVLAPAARLVQARAS